MKNIVKVLLAVVLLLSVAFAVTACDGNCKDGHTWDNGTVTKEANCVEKGVKTFKCVNCDETRTEEIAIDAAKHKGPETAIAPVAPECEKAGSKDGKKCAACGVTIVEPVADPATGHHYDESKYAFNAKQHFYACKDCDSVKGAADHDCVENVCSVCNKELTEAEILEVLFDLGNNESMTGTYVLTGVVTEVGLFNAQYNSIELTMSVGDKSVICYGLKGTDEAPLTETSMEVGYTITVRGNLKRYYNKREFDAGCELLKQEITESDVNVTIENGVTSLPKKAMNREVIEFTVTPNEGYRVDLVKVNGEIVEAVEGKYTMTVLGNMNVEVKIVDKDAPQHVILKYTNVGTTDKMVSGGANNAEKVNLDAAMFTVTVNEVGSYKNTAGLNKDGGIRLYGDSSGEGTNITVSIAEGYTIKSIEITLRKNDKANSPVLSINGAEKDASIATTYTCEINSDVLELKNISEGSYQVWIDSIIIYYTAA